jgi:hypothetical protein
MIVAGSFIIVSHRLNEVFATLHESEIRSAVAQKGKKE